MRIPRLPALPVTGCLRYTFSRGCGASLGSIVEVTAEVLCPFVIDPAGLAAAPAEAASREHAARHARKVAVGDMRRVDVVVCGSVAVNRRGSRLGKGAGYSDIAVALLQEAGRIGPSTVIVTTVHPFQVIGDAMPETEHDFSVDLIVTPDEVIECEPPRRPTGLYWNNLTAAKIAAIPALAARAAARRA